MQTDMRQVKKGHVYRVDTFVVPNASREEFLSRVKATHEVLRAQVGFVRDSLLEQFSDPSESNFITIVEWEAQSCIEGARLAVLAMHRQNNFDPQEMFERLRIKAARANYYTQVDT